MMEPRISLITLAVGDLQASAAFYEALGWTRVKTDDAGIIAFDLLGQVLGLYSRAAMARDTGLEITPGFGGITLGYNVRDKKEVAAICARAVAAGGRVLKEPHDIFWGGHSAFFADLDGHVWEVSHNPFAPVADDGAFQWETGA
ncbi:MAG: VOC family protein [Pseudomonadota bacterium]